MKFVSQAASVLLNLVTPPPRPPKEPPADSQAKFRNHGSEEFGMDCKHSRIGMDWDI